MAKGLVLSIQDLGMLLFLGLMLVMACSGFFILSGSFWRVGGKPGWKRHLAFIGTMAATGVVAIVAVVVVVINALSILWPVFS